MVTVINSATDISSVLHYNENKVAKNVAVCLAVSGYHKDVQDLSFTAKLNRLMNQAALRPTVRRPGVHISINFDPSERLSPEKLVQIAADYMEGIGFADQPYLVYQHNDAGHQHLHIVSLNIDENGRPMETSNIGRDKSEKTRKALEQKYGLVVAQQADKQNLYRLKAVNVSEVIYGKTETRAAISKVLNGVLNKYNFTSLAELNAVLKQYNVMADRGNEDSRVFKNGGLLYHVIDERGNKVGKPIKSSRFFGKATLAYLQERFTQNEKYRHSSRKEKSQLRQSLDGLLRDPKINSPEKLFAALKAEGINTVLRQNEQGRMYGVTFVDHRTRHVFNGSQLGKEYSIAAIIRRTAAHVPASTKTNTSLPQLSWPNPPLYWNPPPSGILHNDPGAFPLLELLTQPEYGDLMLPWHLRIGTKKRKRGRRGRPRT